MCRPKQTVCKRGHDFSGDNLKPVGNRVTCRACFNYRMQLRYHSKIKVRTLAVLRAGIRNRNFREANGYWPSALYDRKGETNVNANV